MGLKDSYRRRYKMRALGENSLNTVVSIPRVVIEREAERYGLSIEQFIDRFRAIAHYNNFEGIYYSFEEG